MATSGARAAAASADLTLLDARAAAAHLGITVAMLRRATCAGEIAHVRLRVSGRGARDAVRWLAADLDAWVLGHRVPAGAPGGAVRPSRGSAGSPVGLPRRARPRGGSGSLLSARAVLRATTEANAPAS